MNKEIIFDIPGNPQALKRHRTVRTEKFNRTYDPSVNDKADFLAKAMNYRPAKPLDQPLFLKLSFYFQRPKAHYRTGSKAGILKDNAPMWHTKTPDADNLVKFVCDALNKVFWRDDSVICALSVMKKYSETPHISIKIIYSDDKSTND